MTAEPLPAAVAAAISTRRSVRRFRPDAVPRAVVEELLSVAARAPSGTNVQPWRVHVLLGAARQRLAARLQTAYDDPAHEAVHVADYAYYPTEWVSPYVERRRKVGWDLYRLLGIGRDDKAAMHQQHRRNFAFFDAPVGLIFTIDRVFNQGSWLDYGMFLQTLMIAARARGLDTCAQAAFCRFHRLIAEELELPASQQLVCGMALGWADELAPENALRTERVALDDFVRFADD